jgi:hypothetical protein
MGPYDVLDMADERFERRLTHEFGAIRQDISALRQEMATRQELSALRQEMATRQELSALRQEMATRQDLSALRQEMTTRQEMDSLRQEMHNGFAQVHQEIASARTEMIKWSFLFWTGQFLAIAGFLLVFLRNR